MKFAHPIWLFGLLLAPLVAAALVWGGVRMLRALRTFGDHEPVQSLLSHRVGQRRTAKGILLVFAVVFAFIAAAGPQYGRGTRLIPATNLDVVLVIDYSKSMYARDITPSRIDRAKVEITRLIRELAGARFGAVAFAGEPISFPITSDGGAIAQFFQQMAPNDMPVGGTAIARALESARALLQRDPASARHQKVILLVTDGEDLEGDPVAVARSAAEDHVVIHVVQIGGRTPEPIPNVNEDGTFGGPRTDSRGQVLTTELSSEGETQLAAIAKAASGFVVQSAQGDTGLTEVTQAMKRMMTEQLSERVETVYADVFYYPLLLCLLLLFIDSWIAEAPRTAHKNRVVAPPAPRKAGLAARASTSVIMLFVAGCCLTFVTGCETLEKRLFTRYSPQVDLAIRNLEHADGGAARNLLQDYLATGACKAGQIGTSPALREKPAASFDLGLALFAVAERFGRRFGDEASPASGGPGEQQDALLARRSQEVDCALQIVRIIAADKDLPAVLRAQAYFLSGNLEFLRGDYAQSVTGYEACLQLVPGDPADGGLTIGDDAAYNRAIALRRIEEQEKQNKQPDAGPPQNNADGGAGEPNKDQDQDKPQKDSEQQDQQEPQENNEQDQQKPQEKQSAGEQEPGDQQQTNQQQAKQQQEPQKSPSLSQDERMLDQLEQAPTVQHQQAAAQRGHVLRGMEDK